MQTDLRQAAAQITKSHSGNSNITEAEQEKTSTNLDTGCCPIGCDPLKMRDDPIGAIMSISLLDLGSIRFSQEMQMLLGDPQVAAKLGELLKPEMLEGITAGLLSDNEMRQEAAINAILDEI